MALHDTNGTLPCDADDIDQVVQQARSGNETECISVRH